MRQLQWTSSQYSSPHRGTLWELGSSLRSARPASNGNLSCNLQSRSLTLYIIQGILVTAALLSQGPTAHLNCSMLHSYEAKKLSVQCACCEWMSEWVSVLTRVAIIMKDLGLCVTSQSRFPWWQGRYGHDIPRFANNATKRIWIRTGFSWLQQSLVCAWRHNELQR
jgi:hypothetical protein